jgi:hypothetical protein
VLRHRVLTNYFAESDGTLITVLTQLRGRRRVRQAKALSSAASQGKARSQRRSPRSSSAAAGGAGRLSNLDLVARAWSRAS